MNQESLNTLVDVVLKTARERDLFSAENPLLLMVSGGCDSTSMVRIFAELEARGEVHNLAALHVNHKLRGGDANDDQAFVEDLCASLNIPLYIVETDVAAIASAGGENVEAVGRRERYTSAGDALASLCNHFEKPYSSGRIVTAHTLNDRVENFYMRSIVGTGPGGFRSMKYKNANIVRPLLDVTRAELENAIVALGQTWREDATNAHTDQFRAFVRHELVPVAATRNEQLHKTLLRTMNLIAEEDDMLDEATNQLLQAHVQYLPEVESFKIAPEFYDEKLPLQKRAAFKIVNELKPHDERVENSSVEAIIHARDNKFRPTNIQFNLVVSSNKTGVLVEPMSQYRARRKRK